MGWPLRWELPHALRIISFQPSSWAGLGDVNLQLEKPAEWSKTPNIAVEIRPAVRIAWYPRLPFPPENSKFEAKGRRKRKEEKKSQKAGFLFPLFFFSSTSYSVRITTAANGFRACNPVCLHRRRWSQSRYSKTSDPTSNPVPCSWSSHSRQDRIGQAKSKKDDPQAETKHVLDEERGRRFWTIYSVWLRNQPPRSQDLSFGFESPTRWVIWVIIRCTIMQMWEWR